MSKWGRVVLLEFNELTPALMDQFIEQGKLPNFARFRSQSQVYVTDAEEQPPNLEPWIQWVTVHCGLPFKEHGVFHLGDGPKLRTKCVWDILSDAGFKVAVCGSMNVRYDTPINGYVLPDPWTTNSKHYPESLEPYVKFVRVNVQEHSNDHVPLSRADYIKFLTYMQTHGLSLRTVTSIAKQLGSEKGGRNRWRRAAILDKLQFDLFRSFYKRMSPDFSTFFLNSTAHMQHMYWRNFDPGQFRVKPSESEQAEFSDAILFGYMEMDKLIGHFMELVEEDTTLIFATALSQQPCLIYEDKGGKAFYRPRDFDLMLQFAGVNTPCRVAPVMSEQFHIYFTSEIDAITAEKQLRALKVDGTDAMLVERTGSALFACCQIYEIVPKQAVLSGTDGATAGFYEIFYRVEGIKSGMHHPDGMLWIRTPDREHSIQPERVSLTSIAPTILSKFGVKAPDYMRGKLLTHRVMADVNH